MYSELIVTALKDGGYVVSFSPPRPQDLGFTHSPQQLAAFSKISDALIFVQQQMLPEPSLGSEGLARDIDTRRALERTAA